VPNDCQAITGVDRRQFLQSAAAAAVVGVVAPASRVSGWLRRLAARAALAPDAALEELMAGNQRFAANQLTSIEHDLAILKAHTVDKQEPFAAVLACADSRVPVELICDQSIGRIFVTRVAGNVVTPELIASLEYAVAVLGVRALLVLGHTNCGAVKAAMKTDPVPGQISALYQHIRPAVQLSGGALGRAIEANAQLQADLLRTSSTVIGDAMTKATISVAAGVYDLATGKVALV